MFQARAALRDRFGQLPRLRLPRRIHADEEQVLPSDEDVLRLLLDTSHVVNTAPAAVRHEYERRRGQPGNHLPDYDEALARGWFRESWGGVTSADALREYLRYQNPPFAEELDSFRHWLWADTYTVANQGQHGSATGLENYLLDPNSSAAPLPVLSPAWIAARLWDKASARDLLSWELKWWLLGRPGIVPVEAWAPQQANEFREAVLSAIRTGDLAAWDLVDGASALLHQGDVRKAPTQTPPDHLLGRFLRGTEAPGDWRHLYDTEALSSLIGILVKELPRVEAGPAPSPTAQALSDLAMEHPAVLDAITAFVRQAPEALADFLFCGKAAPLVCYLTASWDTAVHTERDASNAAAQTSLKSLFEDCLEVLRDFIKDGHVSADEYASLLVAVQLLDGNRDKEQKAELMHPILQQLRALEPEFKTKVRSTLVARARTGADSAEFASLLKVMTVVGTGLDSPEALEVVTAYQGSFLAGRTPYLHLVDTAGAGSLFDMAVRHGSPAAASVFTAVDVEARLRAGGDAASFNTALALRSHIRMLSRGISGFPGGVPDALVDALGAAIEAGSRDQPRRWQVDAFAPEVDTWRKRPQRALEIDIAEAITRLENPAQQARLVAALLKVQEPLVLAGVMRRVPPGYQNQFRTRLQQLTPNEASAAHTSKQLQQRVGALLDAGLADMAEMFMEEQSKLLTARGIPASELEALRTQLQLKYLKQDWAGITSTQLPANFPEGEIRQGKRTLDFYRGLALLKTDPPDASKAAHIFERLHREQPSPATAINLLACRSAKLLPNNPFAVLAGDAAKEAEAAIAEADAALPFGALSPEGSAIHYPNRAALLLALGRQSEALSTLAEVSSAGRSPESTAYEAVANFRHGDVGRANALVRMGEQQFGNVGILKAAADYIAGATPQRTAVKVLTDEGRLQDVRAALSVFGGMTAEAQAEIVSPGALALERLMTDAMRDALSAFTRLIPFLKLNHAEYHENELNTLVASLLHAHVSPKYGWQAHDQTLGGFTKKGNPGERDFVVKKGGEEVAVYEALRTESETSGAIKSHFHKLLSYSTTKLFLHVTFSYGVDPQVMVKALETIASAPPGDFKYRGHDSLAQQTSMPPGVRATYDREGTLVTVIFFVVDMGQKVQRQGVGAPPVANASAATGAGGPPAPTVGQANGNSAPT